MEKRVIFHGHTLRPTGTAMPHASQSSAQRIFLLSPANASGIRGKKLLSGRTQFDLAQRLCARGASLGEIFSFMSALYFRGKLAYAERFANPPSGVPGIFVITSSRGLLTLEAIVTLEELRSLSSARIDHNNPNYRVPLSVMHVSYQSAPGTIRKSCSWGALIISKRVQSPKQPAQPLRVILGTRGAR